MSINEQSVGLEPMQVQAAIEAMRRSRAFAGTSAETLQQALAGVERVERVAVKAETVLVEAGELWKYYWLVMEGETRAERPESNGTWTLVGNARLAEDLVNPPF